MKPNLRLLTLVGLVLCSLTAMAQTNPPADAAPAGTNDTAPAEAPPTQVVAAAEPAAAESVATEPPVPASLLAQADEPLAPGVVIPLIVMDDVPLADAIKNLARQAGINYMLDPRVALAQAGPDGKTGPQAGVSLRWENVTAQQALNALLNNHNLQMIEDPKTKIYRVTIKDPAAPDPLVTKIVQLKYASPTNMMIAIQSILTDKRSKVVPDRRTSQLVILATDKEFVAVDDLIEKLDTPTKQVLIEGRLMETKINPHTDKGIDWSGTLEKQNVTFGNNLGPSLLTMSPSTGPFFNPVTTFLNADGVRAAISFLNTYAETKVLSTPRTVTLDNEPTYIESGTMYPIVNVTASTAQTTGGSQITYSNLTVRLEVTPSISANNYVNLKVHPSILRLGDKFSTIIDGKDNEVDSFEKREIETKVLIPSGNTLVMGGLVQDKITRANKKVPVLGDVPGLGYLFRLDTKDREKSNLIIFITPTIIEDTDMQPTQTGFLKTPVPSNEYIEPDWSAWDSGKPRDPNEGALDPEKYSEIPRTGTQ